MAWTHDEEAHTLRCVSEKHGRDITLDLPKDDVDVTECHECWRTCVFRLNPATGRIPARLVHFFNPVKPQPTLQEMVKAGVIQVPTLDAGEGPDD